MDKTPTVEQFWYSLYIVLLSNPNYMNVHGTILKLISWLWTIIMIFQAANVKGAIVVGHYLLQQYLEEREKLFVLKENRNRFLEQKVMCKMLLGSS